MIILIIIVILINFEGVIESYNYFCIICSKNYILKIMINFLLHVIKKIRGNIVSHHF